MEDLKQKNKRDINSKKFAFQTEYKTLEENYGTCVKKRDEFEIKFKRCDYDKHVCWKENCNACETKLE